MNCDQALELICACLAGELSPDEQQALDAHLSSCSSCAAAAEALQAQDVELDRAFGSRQQVGTVVAERVIARLRAEAKPRRRLPFWVTPLLSAAAGFLVAVGIFRPWERPPTLIAPPVKETIQLTLATGTVEAKQPGENAWQTLPAGAKVEFGCSVRTPEKSRCEFRCPDGSEVRLNAETEVAFRDGRQLDLIRGQILTTVRDAPSPFQVSVDQAKVTALGTQFDLWRQPQETRLTVLQGSTQVDGKGASEVVNTGEVARIVDGRFEGKSPQRDLVKATSWVHEILLLKGRDNPELVRRVDDLLAQIGDAKMASLSEEDIRVLGDHCVLPLTRFVQSERSRGPREHLRRVAATRILADLAQPWSIPDMIKFLDDEDREVRFYAARGLQRLTTETHGCAPNAWRDQSPKDLTEARDRWQGWWDKNKDRYPKPP